MSSTLSAASKTLPQAKSWADVDSDDFFSQVAQDKPAVVKTPTAPTGSWSSLGTDRAEKRSATDGGVPWSFPNPVQSPASGMVSRFDSLSPGTRRSAPMGNWRK